MNLPAATPALPATLERRIGLRSAVLFNMLEMIGVGPFITLPLVIAAAGYRLSVWAWVLGAAIAIADGLVWAELGAAFPRAGGCYAFLREIYGPEGPGNWLSFLYVWQVGFTAPLSIASGCIGLSGFLAVFWPSLGQCAHRRVSRAPLLQLRRRCRVSARHRAPLSQSQLHHASCLGALRRSHRRPHRRHRLRIRARRSHRRLAHAAAPALSAALSVGGLAQATLLATYCYWGYYNICFLGGEVRQSRAHHPPRHPALRPLRRRVLCPHEPGRVCLRSARPHTLLRPPSIRRPPRAARRRHRPLRLRPLGRLPIAALIVWTAFASVFSLLLGYSRVPYAAARDGNYFRFLAAVHPKHGIPHRSLVALGLVGAFFCFFSLAQVITMLVITRILLQFFLQQIGVILLRIRRPDLPRPFRIPLYPLPPLAAMAGFAFLLVYRVHAFMELAVAAAIAASGTLLYLFRARRLRQWPFTPPQPE